MCVYIILYIYIYVILYIYIYIYYVSYHITSAMCHISMLKFIYVHQYLKVDTITTVYPHRRGYGVFSGTETMPCKSMHEYVYVKPRQFHYAIDGGYGPLAGAVSFAYKHSCMYMCM